MNKRIQELSYQCWYNDPDTGKEEFDRTKFAELIVRECLASIPSDEHRGDFGRAVEFCQQQIKQHFGVEQ